MNQRIIAIKRSAYFCIFIQFTDTFMIYTISITIYSIVGLFSDVLINSFNQFSFCMKFSRYIICISLPGTQLWLYIHQSFMYRNIYYQKYIHKNIF